MRDYRDCCKKIMAGLVCLLAGVISPQQASAENAAAVQGQSVSELRFEWEIVPGAVQYEFVLLSGPDNIKENVLLRQRGKENRLFRYQRGQFVKLYGVLLHVKPVPAGKMRPSAQIIPEHLPINNVPVVQRRRQKPIGILLVHVVKADTE